MKKLTKRVQAGGLWFDVPVNINYVAFSHSGDVYCYLRKPPKPVASWKRSMFQPCGMVSLEGADWRECCWYVGDQLDGEDTERREWMARGVELAINKLKGLGDKSYSPYELECLSNSIRAGEVE
ncbi:hypothetical protein GCM10009414_29020 [Tatumella terrea]|uniref:hypothetical protein n=1 Tax=Tatumella terrea TaxID=419007 RepID=UPI0031D79FBD